MVKYGKTIAERWHRIFISSKNDLTMIYQMIDLPPRLIGFNAVWDITRKDFEEVVIPCTRKHVEKVGSANYLLVLNNSIHNYSFCSWFKDILLSLKNIAKWERAAVVTDSKVLKFFLELLRSFIPGDLRCFTHDEMDTAIVWLSE